MRWRHIAYLLLFACCACTKPHAEVKPEKPDSALLHKEESNSLRLARAARVEGQYEEAEKQYRKAFSPADLTGYFELADMQIGRGETGKAIATLESADKAKPNDTDALRLLGNAYIAAGDAKNAGATFDRYLALAPKEPRALNGKAVALDMQDKHGEAQALYTRAIALEPASAAYIENNLALSLVMSGDYKRAIPLLEKLATLPGATPTVRQNLALAYGLSGNEKKARALGLKDLPKPQVNENMQFYRHYNKAAKQKAKAPVQPVGSVPFEIVPPKASAKTPPPAAAHEAPVAAPAPARAAPRSATFFLSPGAQKDGKLTPTHQLNLR